MISAGHVRMSVHGANHSPPVFSRYLSRASIPPTFTTSQFSRRKRRPREHPPNQQQLLPQTPALPYWRTWCRRLPTSCACGRTLQRHLQWYGAGATTRALPLAVLPKLRPRTTCRDADPLHITRLEYTGAQACRTDQPSRVTRLLQCGGGEFRVAQRRMC